MGIVAKTALATALLCMTGPVMAADAATTVVDLNGIAATVVALIGGVLVVLLRTAAKAGVAYLEQRARLELDAATRQYLNDALDRAVTWAIGKVDTTPDLPAVDVRNATVAAAAQYALDRVPDALAHFGITQTALSKMVEARLTDWLDVPLPPEQTDPVT